MLSISAVKNRKVEELSTGRVDQSFHSEQSLMFLKIRIKCETTINNVSKIYIVSVYVRPENLQQ